MVVTIVSWSKNENLREHISIEKIFDGKFEDRLRVATIKEIPFIKEQTSKNILEEWHKKSIAKDFDNAKEREKFRKELKLIQNDIRNYTRMLSEIAEVEDLTDLED